MGEGRILKRGEKLTLPKVVDGSILVYAGEKGCAYRFRGANHKLKPIGNAVYAKRNLSEDEAIEMLGGEAEVQF